MLTKYVNGDTTVNIQYDARGFRRSSTKVKGTTTSNREFIYSDDGRLLYDRINTFERYYLYGQDGIVGFEEDGVVYTYRKNLFGDVTAIYQGTTKVAEYVYDAWGNCTITTNVNGFATRNAIRYRGYYWDNDLNMYYLLTRYYDPQTGRFINADSLDYLDPNNINGLNLYAYCGNNPIMRTDAYGNAGAIIWLSVLLILGGAVVGAVFGALSDHKFGSNIDAKPPANSSINPSINTGEATEGDDESLTFGDRMFNTAKGALLGAWVGSMSTMVVGVGLALLGAATGAGVLIAGGIGTFALGQALALLISPLLFAFGTQTNTPDEDPTEKYETGLPQMK